MCLAIPGKIIKLNDDGQTAIIDFDGIQQKCVIALVENPQVGRYVIIHAGYAIEIMDEEAALDAIEQWKELSNELDMDMEDVL